MIPGKKTKEREVEEKQGGQTHFEMNQIFWPLRKVTTSTTYTHFI